MNYREILEDFVNNEDTYYCYDWQGFDYRTILPCIEQLLKNENNLQSKIDKAIQYCEYNDESLYTFEPDYDYEENMVDNYEPSNFREDIMKILKEDK